MRKHVSHPKADDDTPIAPTPNTHVLHNDPFHDQCKKPRSHRKSDYPMDPLMMATPKFQPKVESVQNVSEYDSEMGIKNDTSQDNVQEQIDQILGGYKHFDQDEDEEEK